MNTGFESSTVLFHNVFAAVVLDYWTLKSDISRLDFLIFLLAFARIKLDKRSCVDFRVQHRKILSALAGGAAGA